MKVGSEIEKKQQITYERRQSKQRDDNCVTEQGLRFDGSVPVEVIEIEHPALKADDAADYTLIDTKVSHRLAQRPGSYVVLEYRRKVFKHIPNWKSALNRFMIEFEDRLEEFV